MLVVPSNFDFLQQDFPELYKAGMLSEVLLTIDYDSCSAKIRIFCESWLHRYLLLTGKECDQATPLSEQIAKAYESKIIDSDTREQLDELRQIGNKGVHVRLNSISKKVEGSSISKRQLLGAIKSAHHLAERIFVDSGKSAMKIDLWTEVIDLSELRMCQGAVNDQAADCFNIAKLKMDHLADLPETNARNMIDLIRNAIRDCEYWLTKAIELDHVEAYIYLAELYSGSVHKKAENKKEFQIAAKKAIKHDANGYSHYILGDKYLTSGKLTLGLRLLEKSNELGSQQAHDLLMHHYANRDNVRFENLIDEGIELNYINAMQYRVISTALVGQFESENKALYIQLKACSAKGFRFIDSLMRFNMSRFSSAPTEDNCKILNSDWALVESYCLPAVFALYALNDHALLINALPELVVAAIEQANTLPDSEKGYCYFIAGLYVIKKESEVTWINTVGYEAELLLKKSRELGCESALEFEDYVKGAKKRMIGRKNKQNRQSVKAKRKQRSKFK